MRKKVEKLVPELRFSEFKGDWQQKQLQDITQKIGSGATPTGGDSNYKESGIALFRSLNVYDGYFKSKNLAFIDQEQANKLNNVNVKKIDILLNITGASIARCCIAPHEFLPARVNQHVMIIRPDNTHVKTKYLALILISYDYKKQLLRLGGKGGSTREALTKNHIENYTVFFPTLEEQEKIASFLNAIALRITQLRRKHELLETYKKGVMQKIFSQQLRFKQDDGKPFPDWQKKKLGELLTIRYGKDHKNLEDGNYPVLGTGGVMRYVNSYLYDKPSILIGRKGTIDKPQFVAYPFWTVDTLFYSEINPNVIPFFLFLVVQFINWQKYNEATGVPSLNITSINSVKVCISSNKKEQEKIANFITSIDKKIEAVALQIETMEEFKKGLLQKMFV